MNNKLCENLVKIADRIQKGEPLSNSDRHIIVFALGVYLGVVTQREDMRNDTT